MKSPSASPTREFDQLVTVIRRLRRECPWDRKQTHSSLMHSLIEETYEAVESITGRDAPSLCAELGDILMNIVLHTTIAEEKGEFTLREVLDGITDKMIRRHPHVFGTARARTANDVLQRWDELKLQEGRTSVLQGIPSSMPALARARRVQERASRTGFDWKRRSEVWKKVTEEIGEVREVLERSSRKRRAEEFGDLLFALVNYARFLRVDPEESLQRATTKFTKRFVAVERELARRGKNPRHSTLEEMDPIWNSVKKRGRRPGRKAPAPKRRQPSP
ncbi:MAG: nucleoside triphosphate pyrophosphohydrolase [Bacteroidota bacterium]